VALARQQHRKRLYEGWGQLIREFGVEDLDGFTQYPLGIAATLPFLLYVEDDEPLHIDTKRNKVTVLFKKHKTEEESEGSPHIYPLDQIDYSANKGILHVTEARVYFTDDYVDPDLPKFSSESLSPYKLKKFYEAVISAGGPMKPTERRSDTYEVVNVALMILNRFISHYRFETEYFFTPNVRIEDFPEVEIYALAHRPLYKMSELRSHLQMHDVKMQSWKMFPLYAVQGHMPLMSNEQRDRIVSRINFGGEVPTSTALILSANKHLEEGNYRQAIIDIQTAFEVKIKDSVEIQLITQGKPADEIDGVLECGIVNLLKDHYPRCPKAKPFLPDSDEYKKWKWAYGIRNALTHSGSTVSEQEANTAFGCYHSTFRYLFNCDGRIQLPELPINLISSSEQVDLS
jgi:hypothetical protein